MIPLGTLCALAFICQPIAILTRGDDYLVELINSHFDVVYDFDNFLHFHLNYEVSFEQYKRFCFIKTTIHILAIWILPILMRFYLLSESKGSIIYKVKVIRIVGGPMSIISL